MKRNKLVVGFVLLATILASPFALGQTSQSYYQECMRKYSGKWGRATLQKLCHHTRRMDAYKKHKKAQDAARAKQKQRVSPAK